MILARPTTEQRLPRGARARARRGVSMIEVQTAFVIFGLVLSGLAPCMVMYTKHLRSLEKRLDPATTYYLVPVADLWSRKLGIAATVTSDVPDDSSVAQGPIAQNLVELVSIDKSLTAQRMTAHATVTSVP
jgi:hypothetical protein